MLVEALGACGSLPSTFVVNEIPTVAAIWPLASYMSSPTAIGSSGTDAAALATAFDLSAQFANVTTGFEDSALVG